MYDKCFICKSKVDPFEWGSTDTQLISCEVCGSHRISEQVVRSIPSGGVHNRHILSGAIRELNERGRSVVVNNLEELRDSVVVPEGPLDQIDRILLYVLRRMGTVDAGVSLRATVDFSVAYLTRPHEFDFLTERAVELGYLEYVAGGQYRLALKGWKHVAELKRSEVTTNQAFIAMSFDSSLRTIYMEAVKPALEQTGYVALRLDDTHFNDKIDDRIVADIRKSGLVIADFTSQKGNVYFEAGFALGLGIPVIWTCRDTDIEAVHFDTRQYNHIVWENADDLREKLIARIEATVPLQNRNNQNRK